MSDAVDVVLGRLADVKRHGPGWMARCPSHEDRKRSLSIREGDDGKVLIKCFAGCTTEAITAALGLTMADLFEDTRTTPRDSRATVQRSPANPHPSADPGAPAQAGEVGVAPLQPDREGLRACTLDAYAEAKGLPVEFLRSLGLSDAKYAGAPAVKMPYVDSDGHERAVRFRISLEGDKFRWKSRSKPCLYGLTRLRKARDLGYVVLVEGESCAQTLWHHEIPALGIPGAANWKDDRDAPELEGIGTVYVVVERDTGGQTVLDWLKSSTLTTGRRSKPVDREGPTEIVLERVTDGAGHTFDEWREEPVEREDDRLPLPKVKLVSFPAAKDVSELYLQNREGFAGRFEEALQAAIPYEEHQRIAAQIRARVAWERAGALAKEPRILEIFERELDGAGVVGEGRLCKLIYLAVTGRFLDRFVSLAIKGPSASGKSLAIKKVLEFFPAEAYYLLTAMSERALAYGTEPLSHRFLVLFEAGGLESDFASYLVRSLLSEGCVRYETVEKGKDGQLRARLVEREGPTGLIVSTTSVALHPENETRLLSLAATDTAEQTKLVLSRLANDDLAEPDLARWHDLQVWLETAEHRVTIPYAPTLADLVPPVAVRLRRDFGAVLSLIRAHALLHQASREHDDGGRVVATIEDYAVVHELVVDIVSEGVEATVPATVRELVEAVAGSKEPPSIAQLAGLLNLDKSATSRRWKNARSRGYLKNLEERRGKPARIVLDDPMPDNVEILPSPERLKKLWTPPSPGEDGYLERLFAAFEAGHVTEGEWRAGFALHTALAAASAREAGPDVMKVDRVTRRQLARMTREQREAFDRLRWHLDARPGRRRVGDRVGSLGRGVPLRRRDPDPADPGGVVSALAEIFSPEFVAANPGSARKREGAHETCRASRWTPCPFAGAFRPIEYEEEQVHDPKPRCCYRRYSPTSTLMHAGLNHDVGPLGMLDGFISGAIPATVFFDQSAPVRSVLMNGLAATFGLTTLLGREDAQTLLGRHPFWIAEWRLRWELRHP